MKSSKLLTAILIVLIAIVVMLCAFLVSILMQPTDPSQTSSTTTSSVTSSTTRPTTTTTTTTTTTSSTTTTTTTTANSTTTTTTTTTTGTQNPNEPDEGGVDGIFLYDVDPDNDGYRILGIDPEYLSWQSPPDVLEIPAKINGVQVTAIGKRAFEGVQSTTIILPEGLLDIYQYAFYGSGAKNINVPSTVIYIGKGAFQKCHFLTSIELPDGVDTIRDDTFRECTYLESVTLPDTLDYIGFYAFAQCQTLTSLTVPKSCIVESTAFNYSPNLTVEYK